MLQSQLLALLDIRGNTYAKQGLFELACIDAQKMIKYAPQLAIGYLRQGTIFSMYGYQKRAIEIYEQGLQHVATTANDGNDNNNTEDQHGVQDSNINQLNHAKEEARATNNRKDDYFARLPAELTNVSIPLLDKRAKGACLSVSKTWMEKVLGCGDAWRTFSVDDKEEDMQLANTASDSAPFVECLTINTSDIQRRRKYLECMRNERFKIINSINFNGTTIHSLFYNVEYLCSIITKCIIIINL